jgi:hypothetical protein
MFDGRGHLYQTVLKPTDLDSFILQHQDGSCVLRNTINEERKKVLEFGSKSIPTLQKYMENLSYGISTLKYLHALVNSTASSMATVRTSAPVLDQMKRTDVHRIPVSARPYVRSDVYWSCI